MSSKESMAIPSEENLASLSNIEDTDEGRDASIPELMSMHRFLIAGVFCVQL